MHKIMHRFLRTENGTTAIEYGLIASLIVLAIVGAITTEGQTVFTNLWLKIGTAL
jgi:pilus assembly protein Flp/PilA